MSNLLKNIPFFSALTDQALEQLGQRLHSLVFRAGEELVQEGTPGKAMFIIKQGRVKVTRSGQFIAELKEPNFFGEISLITNEPRTATVTALTDTECFILSREDFDFVTQNDAFRQGQTPAEWRRRMVELSEKF